MVKIGKLSLAIGGEWHLPADKAERAEILKKAKKARVAEASIAGEKVIGVFKPDETGQYAGALLVGAAAGSAVVIQDIGDGTAWFSAIRDGVPLSGYDRICLVDEVGTLVADVLSFTPSALVVGNMTGATKRLEELFSGLDKHALSKAKVGERGKRAVAIAFAGVAVAAVVAMGVVSYLDGQKNLARMAEQKQRQFQALLKTQEAEQRKTDYKKQVETARAGAVEALKSGVVALDALRALRKHVSGPAAVQVRGGWRLVSVRCDIAAPACQNGWRKLDPAAPQSTLLSLSQGAAAPDVNDLATQEYSQAPIPIQEGVTKSPLEMLTEIDLFLLADVRDRYLPYGVRLTIGKPEEIRFTPPAPPAGVDAEKPATIGRRATIELAGGYSKVIGAMAALPAGFSAQAIELLNIGSDAPSMVLKGYVLLLTQSGPNANEKGKPGV